MFLIAFSNQAVKALHKTDAKMRARVHELSAVLQTEPVPAKLYDVLKLSGQDGHYRIRLSSFRIQYFVDWNLKKIQILSFERRDENTYTDQSSFFG